MSETLLGRNCISSTEVFAWKRVNCLKSKVLHMPDRRRGMLYSQEKRQIDVVECYTLRRSNVLDRKNTQDGLTSLGDCVLGRNCSGSTDSLAGKG